MNAFNGVWNWGYDGVGLVRRARTLRRSGRAETLRRRVPCAAASRVLLDVVYNHLGPSGNYLPRFGPYLATARNAVGRGGEPRRTRRAEVRRYIIDNALMWLRDFHIDGLRLDAAHALVDTSTPPSARRAVRAVDGLATSSASR